MSDEAKINEILQNHEKRISTLESIIIKSKSQKVAIGNKTTLSDNIIELRDKGFFSQPKTAKETHAKIQQTYPCELSRVKVELLRLASKRQLRRASKTISETKYVAYVW